MTWSHLFRKWQGSETQKPFLASLYHAASVGVCSAISSSKSRNVKYHEEVPVQRTPGSSEGREIAPGCHVCLESKGGLGTGEAGGGEFLSSALGKLARYGVGQVGPECGEAKRPSSHYLGSGLALSVILAVLVVK